MSTIEAIVFGKGEVCVTKGEVEGGEFFVCITPSLDDDSHDVGDVAPSVSVDWIIDNGLFLVFPTAEQATAVHSSLLNGRHNK